ncbi:MAG: ral secretion pathway protein-related protein [Bryobacterales bacterium]|nr:ral secretion pathway protein-related protein [Bryobacterales bacterium]
MYSAFWGFREEPFSVGPDPALVCRSRQHDEALARLIYGVQFRKGLIALTGEPGTGKTTLLNCLRDFLQTRHIDCLFFFNSRIDANQLWELIGSNLYLQCDPKSKMELLRELRGLLLDTARFGGTTVLIVDEAQNLGSDVFEEIRLLGNLEDRRGRLLQIVLAGQPEFESKLDTSVLRPLKQRIAYRCCLHPFTESETYNYISARLNWAGMPEQTVFPPNVLAEIHVRSNGIPRVINTICDNLLLTAFAVGTKITTLDMLDAVSRNLRLEWSLHEWAQKVEKDDPVRLDTAFLVRHGLVPAGFNQADGPAPANISNSPLSTDTDALMHLVLKGSLTGLNANQSAASPFRSIWRRIGNTFGAMARFAVKATRALPSHFEIVSNRVRAARSRFSLALCSLRSKLGILAERTLEFRRGTLVSLSVLVCIFGTFGLRKPLAKWLGRLPSAVAFSNPIRPGAIGRLESVPSPMNAERPRSTRRKSIEETGPRAVRIDPVEYTPAARYAGFHGKVFAVVTVDLQGKVKDVQLTGPTAFDLDIAVREVAAAWQFKPAMRNGKRVEGRTLVQVPFR